MTTPGRKEALCNQSPFELTGIDFVWVNPADHRQIAIFFVVEPDELVRPVDTTDTEFTATITGNEDGTTIPIASHAWVVRNDASGNPRLTLQVDAEEEGDFQFYTLTLTDTPADLGAARLDVFCDEIDFSFKQPCPWPFDCRIEKTCPEPDNPDYPVDYLARDFESFRNALLAYSEDRYPQWDAKVPADFGGMMSELFAALGDEFSYIQDRFKREGYLSSLTQDRSFAQLARLVDYYKDPGQAAFGYVVMRTYEGLEPPVQAPALHPVPAGARIWAQQDDRPPIPYEVGETLAQMISGNPSYPVHTHWTDLQAYVPDPTQPCLPIGAREMFLDGIDLLSLPHPPEVQDDDIGGYWLGKTLLIETRPTDPDAPLRRHFVTLDESVEVIEDALMGSGAHLRIHWRAEDALPFELDQTVAFISANLVPVRAGFSTHEDFVTGESDNPALAEVARSIERSGPVRSGRRPAVHRFTLKSTVENGLGWSTHENAAGVVSYEPDITLEQRNPELFGAPVISSWKVGTDALVFSPTDEAVSVEPGNYAIVASHERHGVKHQHRDYADNRGFTIKFGAGVFGRQPGEGQFFRVHYRTGPGAAANVPADTITLLEQPSMFPAPLMPLPAEVLSVTNPFAFTNGRDQQSLELARRIAPAAYKAITFRAVRNEDYKEQIERLDWVQQARSVTRWTGAWASNFVTADPEGSFEIAPDRFAEMSARLSAVRQTGRCVIAKQPKFQPIDLKIAVCLEQGAAFGHVAGGIVRALTPYPDGFFNQENFSFGEPVRRPALEAAIACVPGVKAVMAIQFRLRGITGFKAFNMPQLEIAADCIVRVENDPNRPGMGSIRVYNETIPALEDA